MKAKKRLYLIVEILLTLLMLMFIYPLIVMLFGSLKSATELARNPSGVPAGITLENYSRLWNYADALFFRAFLNSVFVSSQYAVCSITIASMAAYAFSKYRFSGRNVLFTVIIATIMVPTELKMPSLYIMFSKIGILDTYIVQILPTLASVFCMFLMRQHMDSVPDALIEAARIDGASAFTVFVSVVVPMVKPAIGAMTILQFLAKWNDFLWPSMMVTTTRKQPVMVLLPTLNDTMDVYSSPMELIMAGCVCVVVPLLIVFLLNQENFMSSVSMGAVKG